jgi:hypothetical protein
MNATPSATPSGRQPRRSARRRGFALAGFAAAVSVVACGDPYLHTNPYDPDVPVAIVINGPDTLYSLSELAQYGATITPAFPDSAVTWLADTITIFAGDSSYVLDGSLFLTAGTNGQFQSIKPPLEPGVLPITVEALVGRIDTTVARKTGTFIIQEYRHIGLKRIFLTQRVTRIQLRCPDTHTCPTLAVGTTNTVWLNGFDALGYQMVPLTSATLNPDTGVVVATYVSRDSTIARVTAKGIRAVNVTGLKAGSTWIVAMRNVLRDSLQIVVQ